MPDCPPHACGCRSAWILFTLVAVVALLGHQAASAESKVLTLTGPTMGTSYTVKAYFQSPDHAKDLQVRIDRRLSEIDAKMSTYREDSEVSQFNRAGAGSWFPVSEETLHVVQRAQAISKWTDGAFDITVGPLVRLWNFGPDAGEGDFQPPNDAAVQEVLQYVGYQKLELRNGLPALRKTVDGLQVDLSAIAKGYAVDEVGEVLRRARAVGFMVEIGGEVRAAGTHPDGTPWKIGIESPTRNARRLEFVIEPRDMAVASSGDYRNYFEHDGKIYSHTIDPHAGRPVQHQLCAVTVVSDDCATADALATAILVMGTRRGKQWAEENQVAATLITRSGATTTRTQTSRFTEYVPEKQKSELGKITLISMIVFGIALLGMAIGVILGKRRIQGSCGGLAGLRDEKGNTLCEACTNPAPECRGVDVATTEAGESAAPR